jgi:hypothetical protein
VDLSVLGHVELFRGQLDAAGSALQQSLAIRRELGNQREQVHCLVDLGRVAEARADLSQAAQRYQSMDAEALDELISQQQLGMLSINHVSRERLQYRLDRLREPITREAEQFPDTGGGIGFTDIVVMAGLPFFWEASGPTVEEKH